MLRHPPIFEGTTKLDSIDFNVLLTKTMIKSKIVQKLVKYLQKPKATHFSSISIENNAQNPKLVQ